jgi:hypothetical protein
MLVLAMQTLLDCELGPCIANVLDNCMQHLPSVVGSKSHKPFTGVLRHSALLLTGPACQAGMQQQRSSGILRGSQPAGCASSSSSKQQALQQQGWAGCRLLLSACQTQAAAQAASRPW